MRIVKKILLGVATLVILIPVSFFIFFCIIGPALNSARASSLEKTLSCIELPPKTEIIETASYCGNISGTGTYIEIWVGALIRSELPEEEVLAFYGDDKTVWSVSVDENQYPQPRDFMMFSYLGENGKRDGCYIIGDYYKAVTQNDFGH